MATDARLSSKLVFDVREHEPDLWKLVPDDAKRMVDAWGKAGAVPTPESIAPFDGGAAFRPVGHVRAFYHRVSAGVIACKGTEVFCPDFGRVLDAMTEGRNCMNRIDFFVIAENKIPIAYLASEALSDARAGAALYRAVYERFKEPPPLPLPLLAGTWPDDVVARYRDAVLPRVSTEAAENVVRHLREGLGTYLYYFPRSPIRLRHLSRAEPTNAENGERRLALVDGWISLFVKVLVAGYFPCALSKQHGCCVQDQNVCVEGGFVDVDSVEAMSDVDQEGMFVANLLASVQMLAHTVLATLGPMTRPVTSQLIYSQNHFGGTIHGSLILPQVWQKVCAEFAKIRAQGTPCDERLVPLLALDRPLENLLKMTVSICEAFAPRDDEALAEHLTV